MSEELKPYQAFSALRHGHARRINGVKASPTYVSWIAMRKRCNDESRDIEMKYACRGISYDPAWESFERFLSDMGERSNGKTLDRIDNEKGYFADNCQWSTPQQQARNRRNSKLDFYAAVEVAVLRLRGASCRTIAETYGISESLPREIVKGRTWTDALSVARGIVAND